MAPPKLVDAARPVSLPNKNISDSLLGDSCYSVSQNAISIYSSKASVVPHCGRHAILLMSYLIGFSTLSYKVILLVRSTHLEFPAKQ